jgi:uncharacterized protein (TIGR03083 family)
MTVSRTDPDPYLASLQASHQRLRGLVEPLGPDGVRAPAYPTEWSIARVASHLGSSAVIFGLYVDAGLHGGSMPGNEVFTPIWDEWNAKSADDQASQGLAADSGLVDRLTSLTVEERAAWTLDMWSGPTDLAGLLRLRLVEHAVHTWDIAVALDPSATVSADAVALVIDELGPVVGWTGQAHEPARLRVATSEPDREFLLDLGGTDALRAWDQGSKDGELRLSAEAFLRLLYGRTALDHPVTIDPVVIEADGVDVDDLRATFPGV